MMIARNSAKPAGIAGLGLIPSWQFSMDPAVNPKINPFVKFPEGVFQTTVQPLGPYFSGMNGLNGLGESSVASKIWAALSIVSGALSTYHGYKRNESIGWALVWGFFGSIAPIVTPVVAFSQGFGKRKVKK
jgi:hypothetical protein